MRKVIDYSLFIDIHVYVNRASAADTYILGNNTSFTEVFTTMP